MQGTRTNGLPRPTSQRLCCSMFVPSICWTNTWNISPRTGGIAQVVRSTCRGSGFLFPVLSWYLPTLSPRNFIAFIWPPWAPDTHVVHTYITTKALILIKVRKIKYEPVGNIAYLSKRPDIATLCYWVFAYRVFLQRYKTFSGWFCLFHGLHGNKHIANQEYVSEPFLLGGWIQDLWYRIHMCQGLHCWFSWTPGLKFLHLGQYYTLFPSNRKLICSPKWAKVENSPQWRLPEIKVWNILWADIHLKWQGAVKNEVEEPQEIFHNFSGCPHLGNTAHLFERWRGG